jgi:hypothetical protein
MSAEGQIHPCHARCKSLFLTPEHFQFNFIGVTTILLVSASFFFRHSERLKTKALCKICGTFRLESSFPAKARSRLVFPDPGGPSNNDILKKNPCGKQTPPICRKFENLNFEFPDFLPAGFYDPTDVMKNGDRLLPAWNYVQSTQHTLR